MKRASIISTRTSFIIIILTTLALLVGSVLLQRIVFKAEKQFSNLYLSPATFRATQGTLLDLTLYASSKEPISASGVELVMSFDENILELTELEPIIGWETVLRQISEPEKRWILTPATGQPSVWEFSGETALAKLKFRTKQPGFSSISLNQAKTVLVGVDTREGNVIYNAAESVQSSAGTVTAKNEKEINFPEADGLVAEEVGVGSENRYKTQRILSSEAIVGEDKAVILTRLAYRGKVSVEFGPTTKLINKVESSQVSSAVAVPISGLVAGERYYYRVIGEESNGYSRIVGPVKSFSAEKRSGGTALAEYSRVVPFPERVRQEAQLFIVTRDGSGLVEGQPSLRITTGEVSVSDIVSSGGYHEVKLSSLSEERQNVNLEVYSGDVLLSSKALVFDPELKEVDAPAESASLTLVMNQKVLYVIAGGLCLLFLLGLAFFRLVRVR